MDTPFELAVQGDWPSIRFADRRLSPMETYFETALVTPAACDQLADLIDGVRSGRASVLSLNVNDEMLWTDATGIALAGARPDRSDGRSLSLDAAHAVVAAWRTLVHQIDDEFEPTDSVDRPARTDYFLFSPVGNEVRRGAAFQIHDRGRSLSVVLDRNAGDWVVQPEFDRALAGITDTDVTPVTRAEFTGAVRAFGGSGAAVDQLDQAIVDSTVLLRRSGPGPQPWGVMA